ncbi:MAG: hypothetical protein ACK4VO_06855 [Pseudobdellovibrio sp.]
MPNISEFRNGRLSIGVASSGAPTLAQASIDGSGTATLSATGTSVVIINDNTNTITGEFQAIKVWNAVWNDIADFQKLDDQLVYGKCYFDTLSGAKICTQKCQKSVIGIASDTFGFGVGSGNSDTKNEVPIAVAGWTLAFVDQEYEPGTALTNDQQGNLTKMSIIEKLFYPERMIAIYKRKETKSEFGTSDKRISVNGRHWVKVS